LYLRQLNRLAFLFSPAQITLKNSPAECPESYHPHLIRFLNEITPIKSLLLRYEEGGCLLYGEYIYSAGTLSCRELPVSHYPDATDSDSDQEHLQQAFERYGTTRLISFS